MVSGNGCIIATPLSNLSGGGGLWMVSWRDAAGRSKSGRADHPESLLRLVAHALREQGHDVPALVCLPFSASPPRPLPSHEERHAVPVPRVEPEIETVRDAAFDAAQARAVHIITEKR